MIKRHHGSEYEFRLNAPQAQEVFLVGEFGPHQDANLPMARTSSGEWVCRLNLSEGVYHFKYWVDGRWCLDEDPEAYRAAPFLTSSLVVLRPTTPSPAYVG